MILLADSGSTKTTWCLARSGTILQILRTAGINPFFQTPDQIAETLQGELMPALDRPEAIRQIHFYGAGCAFPDKNQLVEQALRRHFSAPITIDSDLMAAARSLCGHRPGIACILGTGSNSCRYDGQQIVEQVSPLGYILGDEGSGATLGKLLVGDCLKRQLPAPLIEAFWEETRLTPAEILDRVYKQPFPNRFLASLSPFLARHLDEPAIRQLVGDSFRSFFRRNVLQYSGCRQQPIHFVGSVAYHYAPVLHEAADSLGIRVGTIRQAPLEGLLHYHTAS